MRTHRIVFSLPVHPCVNTFSTFLIQQSIYSVHVRATSHISYIVYRITSVNSSSVELNIEILLFSIIHFSNFNWRRDRINESVLLFRQLLFDFVACDD